MPGKPWEHVHIDFVVELPESEGCSTVMTVVDRFSKMAFFVPLTATDAASVAAEFFS